MDIPVSDQPPAVSERQRWHTFALCVLGWMFDHYDLMLFVYVARAIGAEWEWGEDHQQNAAFLVGIALFTSGIGGVVFGGLADRFGRRRHPCHPDWPLAGTVHRLALGLPDGGGPRDPRGVSAPPRPRVAALARPARTRRSAHLHRTIHRPLPRSLAAHPAGPRARRDQ